MGLFGKRRRNVDEDYFEDDSKSYLKVGKDSLVNDTKEFEIKVFQLVDYDNIRDMLDVIRENKTIGLINIRDLRNKNADDLRRAVEKLKKTISAISGSIVTFDENWILVSPKTIKINKNK